MRQAIWNKKKQCNGEFEREFITKKKKISSYLRLKKFHSRLQGSICYPAKHLRRQPRGGSQDRCTSVPRVLASTGQPWPKKLAPNLSRLLPTSELGQRAPSPQHVSPRDVDLEPPRHPTMLVGLTYSVKIRSIFLSTGERGHTAKTKIFSLRIFLLSYDYSLGECAWIYCKIELDGRVQLLHFYAK